MFKRAEPFIDPELGQLEHRRGHWRGAIRISPFGSVSLAVPGSKKAPDDDALVLARSAADQFEQARAAIVAELVDHGTTLGDDVDAARAAELAPAYVAVVELDRRLVLEFGFAVPWDDDHTLGARVGDGTLIELNGSVIAP